MVSAKFFLGAYWGSRVESVEVCAGRFARFLDRLVKVDPLLSTWFHAIRSQAETLRSPITPNQDTLRKILQESLDIDSPKLGFSLVAVNGHDLLEARFSLTCGSDAAVSPNVVRLNLPRRTEESRHLYQPETMKTLFRAVVEEWDPAWALFGTREMRDMQGGFTGKPFAGWLTYIRDAPATLHHTETNIDIVPLGSGTLLVAGADPVQVTTNHIKDAAALLGVELIEP